MLTLQNGGELSLAGAFGDTYATAPLDAQWTGGAWAGGAYTPTVSGGVLTVDNGNFVRSTATRAVATLEARAQFGNAPWQHIGWGDLNFANNRYLLFSTFNNSTNLWARSANNGPEQRTDLGPIPAGMHTYRIERVGNAVRYSIDGTLRAEHTLANVPALHVYQSYNSSAGTTLQVDRLWTYPDYALSGSIDSCVLDGGTSLNWTSAAWAATTPAGTAVQLRTRSSADGTTWSAWSAPLTASGQPITSPDQRYTRSTVSSSARPDAAVSPVVNSVTIGVAGGGVLPTSTPLPRPTRLRRPILLIRVLRRR